MRRAGLLLVICAVVFAAAFAAERVFVPGVKPVASAEEGRSVLALETAFILRSIENVAALTAAAVFVVFVVQRLQRR